MLFFAVSMGSSVVCSVHAYMYCMVCYSALYRYSSLWKGSLVLYCGKYGLVERLGE